MMRRSRVLATATTLAAGLFLAGCGGGDADESNAPEDTAEQTEAPAEDAEPTEDTESAPEADAPEGNEVETPEPGAETEGPDDGCFIHLFDGEDLDDQDDNFQLIDPGEYKNLADLPGADRDWTDEADSLRVGSGATVTIYSDENFEGTSEELQPDTELADVEHEPKSLEMVCE